MPPDTIRILIVEDNSGDALLEEIALREQPFATNVHCVTDGTEALAYLTQRPPYQDADTVDLILLDGRLNGESSLAILNEIKESPTLQSIPVVLVTGSAREQEREDYLSHGAAAVLNKPAAFEDLVGELAGLRNFL